MATVPKNANDEIDSNVENKKGKSKKKDTENNDENSVEVEATVKITKPKKTISTSVEIERQILPDGTVEETKTTTTNTIINDKIEDSKVQKETRILSDEEAKAVIVEESEEEEEEEIEEQEQETIKENTNKSSVHQNGHTKVTISESKTETKKSTKSETTEENETSNKKQEIVSKQSVQETESEEEEEVEEVEEADVSEHEVEEVIEEKSKSNELKTIEKQVSIKKNSEGEEEEEEEEAVVQDSVSKEENTDEDKNETVTVKETTTEQKQVNGTYDESEEEEEEEEEDEGIVAETENKTETKVSESVTAKSTSASVETKEEVLESKSTSVSTETKEERAEQVIKESDQTKQDKSEDRPIEIHIQQSSTQKDNIHTKTETSETKTETISSTPIPEVHTTTKKETTEILSRVSDTPFGNPISTQTELHRVENIVTVNKTTKSLDNSYEQMTQQGLPTVKTYFAPTRERISTSPLPAKPYTPTFTTPEKPTGRRHSLLLDRLSSERQFAQPDCYQNTYNYSSNQTYESSTNQLNQEPQSEVVIASNVKPSSINNSQWYQPTQSLQSPQPAQPIHPSSNIIYNNVKPTTPTPQPAWQQNTYDNAPYSAPVYQPEPNYVPKPSSWGSSNLGNLDRLPSLNTQSSEFSFMNNNNSTESYSQQTTQTQHQNTGYVPPPWESEKSVSFQPHQYYEPQTAPVLSSNMAPTWKAPLSQQNNKKRPPLAYQPPAPNASFVKQASPAPVSKQLPGRKTYYSEYERRYISVPESTYIPTETKVQPQWDPSPQYYYDNPEPTEEVEQPWRKELREFTEKSTKEETTIVQPPWQNDQQYSKDAMTYSPQPTWSQTLRPRSWREKSYESESRQQSQEWPRPQNKRPVSAFIKSRLDSPSVERTRGVSVDRYNANSYQSPTSYIPSSSNGYSLPWESQEQIPTPVQYAQPQTPAPSSNAYHNPQVPAYHVRSTETRDYQMSYQPKWSGQGRERPVQSRSFKYLQMLTGTEDGVEEPEPFVVQQPQHAMPKPRRF